MGILDKAKAFAGKKYAEFKEAEKVKAAERKVETDTYKAAYAQARISALKTKAKRDARASVLPKQVKRQDLGAKAFAVGNYMSGGGPFSRPMAPGKPAKPAAPYRPMDLDSMDFNSLGAGAMFRKKRR